MTVTPYLIADYLTPWVLATMACALLFLSVKYLVTTGPRVAAALATGQPPHTRRNRPPSPLRYVSWAALFAAAAVILAEVINEVGPAPQSPWWSHPLASGWEVSHGFATILMVVAGQLLVLTAALLAGLALMALMAWLAEPVDAAAPALGFVAEPGSPNRAQWLRGAVVTSWNSYRRTGTRANSHSPAASVTGERA